MSRYTGCQVAILVLIVAVFAASFGFAAGFISRTIIVESPPWSRSTAVAEDGATRAPDAPTPMPAPTRVPPTPVPTRVPPTPEPTALPTDTPAPTTAPPTAAPSEVPSGAHDLDRFWEVWRLVEQDFYGDLPAEEDLVNGLIRGALNTLDDPFTGYIQREAAVVSRQDDSGSFEGIGAYISMEDGLLIIVSTFKDQPASRAGLQPGDVVVQVDDTPIVNISIYEAIALIRGPAGTKVRLTIRREGEPAPFEVELTRARIDIPVVESEMRPDGVAYVRLLDFSTDASTKLESALQSMLTQDPKGLVLDLRGNPGGWLREAVLVANLFLPKDSLVLIERFKVGEDRLYRTELEPVVADLPMVVLVDAGSASASEIVAGALQDFGRAVLVGETTFGKGSVQLAYELSDGAELRVTVARWYTPDDRAIHGQGLSPDVAVELTQEDVDAGRDPQLDAAVERLLAGQ